MHLLEMVVAAKDLLGCSIHGAMAQAAGISESIYLDDFWVKKKNK